MWHTFLQGWQLCDYTGVCVIKHLFQTKIVHNLSFNSLVDLIIIWQKERSLCKQIKYTLVYSWDLHIRVIRAGFFAVPLRLPAAVAVDQLCQIGCLLGVPCDELVLQELLGRWPLCRHSRQMNIWRCHHRITCLKSFWVSDSKVRLLMADLRYVVQVTHFFSFQVTQIRSVTWTCTHGKSAWNQLLPDRIQASLVRGNKSDMNKISANMPVV